MKKQTLKLLALLLACLMLLPLVIACDKDDNPTEPTGKKEPTEPTEIEKFNALNEQEKAFYILDMDVEDGGKTSQDMTLNLACKYMGYDVVATMTGKQVEIDTADKYLDYTDATLTMSIMGTTVVTVSKDGYIDGRAFSYASDGSTEEGRYVTMTKEAYISENKDEEDEDDSFGLTKDNCSTVTCVKSGNNWVATFTDITGDGLNDFKELVGSFEGMINSEDLVDVTLVLTVSSDLKPISARVDFEFSGEDKPQLSMDCNYKIGADVTEPTVDMSDYTETDSLE